MVLRLAILIFSVLALTACESHKSAHNKAADRGAQTVSVYAPPSDPYRRQSAAAPQAAPSAYVEPVALQPVSAVYLSDEQRAQAQYQAQPARTARQIRRGEVIVQPGDTIYAIGRRYGVSPKVLIAENKLRHPYPLAIGQTLKLPKEARIADARAAEARAVNTRNARITRKVVARDKLHAVRPGDTLYSISRSTGVPVTTIAQTNNIAPPYTLSPGQQLLIPQARIESGRYAANTRAARTSAKITAAPRNTKPRNVAELAQTVSYTPPKPTTPETMFEWPVRGKVIASYGVTDFGRRNDGVNIAAPAGTPVRAAADGEVVYRGSELDGFGNLLLVKHAGGFVTAYAHNEAMLVKKGSKVRQGQVIAKVGQSGAVSSPQLHFEVRRNLKSIDPATLLSAK
ncbi:Membrane protein [hydrothermal vent metagenome]|uniref:Membrane protein n=1 Tax=hydrothermal vent metagenome TaxID=652676 RepID=A0A3B0T5X5_9ZZZZ